MNERKKFCSYFPRKCVIPNIYEHISKCGCENLKKIADWSTTVGFEITLVNLYEFIENILAFFPRIWPFIVIGNIKCWIENNNVFLRNCMPTLQLEIDFNEASKFLPIKYDSYLWLYGCLHFSTLYKKRATILYLSSRNYEIVQCWQPWLKQVKKLLLLNLN